MAWDTIDDEIIAYLAEELTASEKEAFEQRLQTDPVVAEALARHRSFEDVLHGYPAHKQQKTDLTDLYRQFDKKQSARPFRLLPYSLVIAAVLAILIAVFWVLPNTGRYCPEELYAEVFIPRDAPQYAGQAQDATQLLRSGHTRFNEAKPVEAAASYQQALAMGTLSPELQIEARFFLGQSLMQQGDYTAALTSLAGVTDGPAVQLSQWYIALCHLALGQIDKAKPILEDISQQPAHDRQAEASALLKKWKKLKECD